MDEPGLGFVHGRGQRCRRLETAPHHRHFWRAHLWRFQGAGLHFLLADRDHHCRADHEYIEVGDQSQTAKARRFGPHGATGERATGVHVDLQETGRAPFGRIRPEARRSLLSVGAHDEQYNRSNLFDAVLPARLALLDFCRPRRLFANLLGRTLAERRNRYRFFGGRRDIFCFGRVGTNLAMGSAAMGTRNFCAAPDSGC